MPAPTTGHDLARLILIFNHLRRTTERHDARLSFASSWLRQRAVCCLRGCFRFHFVLSALLLGLVYSMGVKSPWVSRGLKSALQHGVTQSSATSSFALGFLKVVVSDFSNLSYQLNLMMMLVTIRPAKMAITGDHSRKTR